MSNVSFLLFIILSLYCAVLCENDSTRAVHPQCTVAVAVHMRSRTCYCLFCLLLVPGAKECPQAPRDDAGRETPERKGLRKSQVEGLCLKRFAQVQGRVAHGARWAAGVVFVDVPDCCWVSERWVLGRAWHRAAIGGREGW
eukprot:scaffold15478_cov117-Isochrysis_galbana.AAC.2